VAEGLAASATAPASAPAPLSGAEYVRRLLDILQRGENGLTDAVGQLTADDWAELGRTWFAGGMDPTELADSLAAAVRTSAARSERAIKTVVGLAYQQAKGFGHIVPQALPPIAVVRFKPWWDDAHEYTAVYLDRLQGSHRDAFEAAGLPLLNGRPFVCLGRDPGPAVPLELAIRFTRHAREQDDQREQEHLAKKELELAQKEDDKRHRELQRELAK
jgi:hypothetical protein